MTDRTAPSFSIIIPTRERCDTLRATLRTCVDQDYQALEIIVADNFSGDDTRNVVSSYRDPRLVYVNSGRRLSMSDNWEFAYSHATGQYVMFLGDDDGLLPRAISEISSLILQFDADAVAWVPAIYHWKTSPVTSNRDKLILPWRRSRPHILRGLDVLVKVATTRAPYFSLPMPYIRAVVRRNFMEALVQTSGRLIWSQIPDVYLGVATAPVIERLVQTDFALSIGGVSSHSTGASALSPGSPCEAEERFLVEDNLPIHPSLEYLPITTLLLWDCLLQAIDHVGFRDDILSNVRSAVLLDRCMEEFARLPPDRVNRFRTALLKIADKQGLTRQIEARVQSIAGRTAREHVEPIGYNLAHGTLVVSCDTAGIGSVAEAALVASRLYKMKEEGIFRLSFSELLLSTWQRARQKIITTCGF